MYKYILSSLKFTEALKNGAIFYLLLFFLGASSFAQTENYRGITIYIDFSDIPRPSNMTDERLDGILNGFDYTEPTIQRSMSKYWFEETRGKILMEHDIFYYRAPQPSTYYANLGYAEGILMWRDALEYVIENNPDYDWDQLSRDDNGRIRSAMFYHSDSFVSWIGAAHYPGWTLSNGVRLRSVYGSYLVRNGQPSAFLPIHESGHAIFAFPDTYDTEGDSGGTGAYTVMSGGFAEIEPIGAPFRAQMGWGNIILPEGGTQTIILEADGDDIVVFRNPDASSEYFSIEARKKNTLGNSRFPVDLGLLVWHSDLNVNTSNREEAMTQANHYVHSIEQADGLFELERNPPQNNKGDEGDIFLPGRTFTNNSSPSSKWWDGSASDFEITNIQFVDDDHIQFDVTLPGGVEIAFVPDPAQNYYLEVPEHNVKIAATGESEDVYTTAITNTGADVQWQFVQNASGLWHIRRAEGGSLPGLRTDGTENADMQATTSTGGFTQFQFTQGVESDAYFLTIPGGTAGFNRLQVDDNLEVKMVGDDRNGAWESIRIVAAEDGTLSIPDISTAAENMTLIYPNPVWFKATIANAKDMTINVRDLSGRSIFTQQILGKNELLDFSKLAQGIYYVEVGKEGKRNLIKLIKR